MRKLILTSILTILLSSPSLALTWTSREVALQTSVVSSIAVDWAQTRRIGNNSSMYETNPILGRNPEATAIDSYMLTSIFLHTAIAQHLPDLILYCGGSKKSARISREVWQRLWLGIESNCIENNYSMGLTVNF
jgi:hypothetical protein